MTSNNAWWGYSLTHGWVVLDREDIRNESRYQLYFIRCSDWAEIAVGREEWDAPECINASNYIAGMPENCRAGIETLLTETQGKWQEMKASLAVAKVTLANEKAIAVRRVFWKSEIQQDIDDENYIRAKERYNQNCSDWWEIDIDEMLTQIKELNERRLAIVKIKQKRTRRGETQREIEDGQARQVLMLAEKKAAYVPQGQQFKAYWQLRIASLALSYLTNTPVDTSRDPRNSACWVMYHDIDYLVGLYALRFDLAPPPEVPTWWAAASKHFSIFTYDWDDFHIELLSEKAEKLHYHRRAGCTPIFMEKTPAEYREEADAEEAGHEQLYHEQLQADPNYQEDVQNQQIEDSVYDALSSEGFWVSDEEYWRGLPSVRSTKTNRSRGSSASRSKLEITEEMLSEAGLRRLAALKVWRFEQAREKNLPAYVVFHDPTLVAVAGRAPKSLAEMTSIPGMSESKLAAYGQMILGVLKACS